MVQLSQQQGAAVKAVVNWFKTPSQVFELSGPAGSGKTTLAKSIAQEVGGNVLYLAFTGKAALVLAEKGCTPSQTIHSLIYKAHQNEYTGKWHYKLDRDCLRDLNVSLVIVDEAPMVGAELAEDLLQCCKKVLALGDKNQLPPVKQEAFFGVAEPDFLLTEIHRQAAENPIIALSVKIRNGEPLKYGNYGDSRILRAKQFEAGMLLEPDQVLVGKNDTRSFMNNQYREQTGSKVRSGWEPEDGERLICLRNNKDRGFLNGQMFKVDGCTSDGKEVTTFIKPWGEDDIPAEQISTPIEYFQGRDFELDWRIKKGCDEFCFAYAITVHKSQGSQWSNVMIFDQSKIFKEFSRNWLYTALTRASEKITLFA